MKSDHPIITLLGNNSGRNLGDAAILASIIDILTKELPDAEFLVPSTHPQFIRKNYGKKYNVKAVNVMPWTISLRLLGLPTFWCIARSDIALICDGIIFGKKILNPAFNFLVTLVFVVAWAKLCGTKIVCYSCGIGPFPSFLSRIFARWVINGSDLVIMRENDSKNLAQSLGVTQEIEVTGDAAFLNLVSSKERAEIILKENGSDLNRRFLGINVTSYFDSWLEPSERVKNRAEFFDTIISGILAARKISADAFEPLVFSTQPMDEAVSAKLASRLECKVIDNSRYLSHDIQAVMARCELFVAMRFHAAVLASAVETPIIGLIYAPKVRGFMRLLECPEYALELAQITEKSLSEAIVSAWHGRVALKVKQKVIVDRLKEGALNAAKKVRLRYYDACKIKLLAPPLFLTPSICYLSMNA